MKKILLFMFMIVILAVVSCSGDTAFSGIHTVDKEINTETIPGTDIGPSTETIPGTDIGPSTETIPGTDIGPSTEIIPGTDIGPSTETIPGTDIGPSTPIPWDGVLEIEPTIVGDAYQIKTPANLAWLEGKEIENNIIFMANIDMNNRQFDGIKMFSKIMDGNGKTIKNLTINNVSDNAGLIAVMTGGEIKNLTILSGNIKSSENAGAFVGTVAENAKVKLSGLINKARVEGNKAGGVIGESESSIMEIEKSENFGDIVAFGLVSYGGGIIALNSSQTTIITGVKNSGTIKGYYVGGIIGVNDGQNTTIKQAMNLSNVETTRGMYSSSGGIIGYFDVGRITIENAANIGNIKGTGDAAAAAGIIGVVSRSNDDDSVKIQTSYNYGKTTITEDDKIKGFKGGFVGELDNFEILTIKDSFYLTSVFSGAVMGTGGIDGATPINVDKFEKQSTFSSWRFNDVWEMGKEFPILR